MTRFLVGSLLGLLIGLGLFSYIMDECVEVDVG